MTDTSNQDKIVIHPKLKISQFQLCKIHSIMNYIKILNTFAKFKPSTLLNVAQPTGAARFSKFEPIEKFPKNHLQSDDTISEQIKKFTTFAVKNEKTAQFNYKIGSKSILEQLKNTPLENIKACIKINDVVVLVRKDIKNSRTITLKLTKEYLKPVSRTIPMSLKSPSVKTQALVMTNKEITPPFLNDTAKYLNLMHDYCTEKKSLKVNKKVEFIDHASQKHSDVVSEKLNTEIDIEPISEVGNDNFTNNCENHLQTLNKSLEKDSKICFNPEEKYEKTTVSQKNETDNDITQYLLNTTKYLNSLQDCCIKTSTNTNLNCTKYITDRDIQYQKKPEKSPRTKNASNREMKILLKKQKELSELCYPKKTEVNMKEMLSKSLALELDPDLKSNKVVALNKPSLLSDLYQTPSKYKLLQMSLAAMISNSPNYNRNSNKDIIKNQKNQCGHLLHPKVKMSNLISNKMSGKTNQVRSKNQDEEEICNVKNKKKLSCTSYSSSIIKKCLSAVRTSNKNNNLVKYLGKLSGKSTENVSKQNTGEMVKFRENYLKTMQNCNVECHAKNPPNLTTKYKIIKLSLGELLSNTDYLNKQPNIEVFKQCMQFADTLKKDQDKNNGLVPSNIPLAELISNKVKLKNGLPCLSQQEKKGKHYEENNSKKSVNFMSQEIAQNDRHPCVTQIGSKVSKHKHS